MNAAHIFQGASSSGGANVLVETGDKILVNGSGNGARPPKPPANFEMEWNRQ